MAGPNPATTEWVPLWNPVGAGPIGPQGPQGIQGIQGIQGPQGTPGEKWYAGSGVPSGSLAGTIVGDWYLDTATGDVYEKTSASAWTLRANIRGPQGIQGIQGIQGPIGIPGEVWFSGSGVPAGSLAGSIVGDWYLDSATGDVYEKTGTTTWTLRANIRGPQGIQGIQGIQGPIGNTGPAGATAPHHVNHETGGTDAIVALSGGVITTGTVADARLSSNVALKNINNNFSTNQSITGTLNTTATITSNSAIVAVGAIHGHDSGGYIYPGRTDAPGTGIQSSFYVASHGSYGIYINTGIAAEGLIQTPNQVYGGQGLRERGRGYTVGAWIPAGPPSAMNTGGSGGSITFGITQYNEYTLIGNTMFWKFAFVNMVVVGPAGQFAFNMPDGFTMAGISYGSGWVTITGVGNKGCEISGNAGASYVVMFRSDGAVFPTSNPTHLYGHIICQLA